MKRLIAIVTLIQLICSAGTMNADTIASFSSSNNGFAASASGSYRNTGQTGGLVFRDLASTSYRNFSGFIPAQTLAPAISVIDNTMSFSDESPASSEVQTGASLTFKVTVQVAGGNTIASVSCKLSTAGVDGLASAPFVTGVTTDTVITSGTKVRYAVTLTGLSVSANNYIEWFAKNDAGADAPPAIFRISVRAPNTPAIVITQPDTKGGVAGTHPQIQATVTDPDLALDTGTIAIKLVRSDGGAPADLDITSAGNPAIYAPASKLVSYKYEGAALTPNTAYTLTVSARSKSGTTYTTTMSFTVKGGAIADLVPYPSPFDPRVQPIQIRYVLDKDASISINIYDMSGRLVRNIVNDETRRAGINEDPWTGINYAGETLANGVYFCEVVAKDDSGEHRRYTSLAIFGK